MYLPSMLIQILLQSFLNKPTFKFDIILKKSYIFSYLTKFTRISWHYVKGLFQKFNCRMQISSSLSLFRNKRFAFTKCSSKTLQNLLYFKHKKNHIYIFFVFPFVLALDFSRTINVFRQLRSEKCLQNKMF